MKGPSAGTRGVLLAAALYLAGALFALRAVLPAPATLLLHAPTASKFWEALVSGDQYYSVAVIAFDARTLVRAPWRLMDGLQCWPMPHATTLGEHMIGEGLLAVVPQLLFGEPILTYNVVLILLPWIAGLTMYALVTGLTGSAPAGLLAGALFAFHPARLGNTAEPYWMGNQWTPLALLFAYRLCTRRRWSDACGLAVFTSLQLLDSFYPIVAFTLVGGPFLLVLLIHARRGMPALVHARPAVPALAHARGAVPALAPKLAAASLLVAAVGAAVFTPYLATRAAWSVLLSGRDLVLHAPSELSFGGQLYPGTVALVLAVIGLLDRRRTARSAGEVDVRLALLVGGMLVLWAVMTEVPILGARVPSLLVLAQPWVPGLDAVRVGIAIASGFFLVTACLAGFGARVLLAVVPARARSALTALLVVVIAAEMLHPALARTAFGRTVTFTTRPERPPDDVRALYREFPPGAVLDLPANVYVPARYVFLSAYHERPTVGCYGSFPSPLTPQVVALAGRLHTDAGAAAALAALGVHTVVTSARESWPFAPGTRVRLLGRTGTLAAYTLDATTPADAIALVAGSPDGGPIAAVAAAPGLALPLRNAEAGIWIHPAPLRPSVLRAEWLRDGQPVADARATALLPLVLPAGESTTSAIDVRVPPSPGDYRLVLRLASDPTHVLADVPVRVAVAPVP